MTNVARRQRQRTSKQMNLFMLWNTKENEYNVNDPKLCAQNIH